MSNTTNEGIVLRTIKYSENQLILHLFTRKHGRISTIVQRSRKRGSTNYFQPLFHLNFELNYNENKSLYRINQLKFAAPYQTIPFSIFKTSIVQFLAEVLSKVLPEHESDKELFLFLTNSFHLFDQVSTNTHNFHLIFLVHLTRFLGFFPGKKNNSESWFSPSEGTFVPQIMHDTIPDDLNHGFNQLIRTPVSRFYDLEIADQVQQALLSQILDFYHIHLNVTNLKSYKILKQIFNH